MTAKTPNVSVHSLIHILHGLAPIALAFSGGLDSRFVAHMAHKEGLPIHLFHITGPHVQKEETRAAIHFAASLALPLTIISRNPLTIPQVATGDPVRCYYCKHALFSHLATHLAATPSFTLCDGTNASDHQTYRPGLQALQELGVQSPLALAALSKPDIQALAISTALVNPTQRPRPCLLTRLPYNVPPTHALLAALDTAESAITALLMQWHTPTAKKPLPPDFRLRPLHANGPPFEAELHLSCQLTSAQQTALRSVLMQHNFTTPTVLVMSQVSGYHDKTT